MDGETIVFNFQHICDRRYNYVASPPGLNVVLVDSLFLQHHDSSAVGFDQ